MSISPQEKAEFQAEVSAWFTENRPADPGYLLPQSFMEVGTDQQFDFLRTWQRKVYDAGYLGMAWPKEYGGGGKDQAFQDIATAEMVAQKVPFMTNTIGLSWAGPLILNMGPDAQKEAYIKRILSAEDIWCQGFSEPDHGSDLGNAQLRAVRDGDEFVLNGSKIWTSLGSYADFMILLARSNTETNTKYEGLSYFLIPMKIPGIDPVPIKKLTGEFGFTQTFFDNVRVPDSCLIGEEGKGWQVAMKTLTFERAVSGGQAGGVHSMQVSTDEVVEMARHAMRDGHPAIEDAIVRDQLVAFMMEERGLDLNNQRDKIPGLASEWPGSIAMARKLTNSEWRRRLNQFAMTLQGANASRYVGDDGAIDGGRWQRGYFNAFSGTIGGGTSQVQKNIVGERVLGLPKSE
ncbi:MAG: acyl-CoA dehydrogenase [Rhodospirillaceae bacterium]|nr:acyl-CoA dehydrogenase [Rhodospirillaceae bacterium]MBT5079386.1 acyl-CoA dehydrogenase [Rhodospirillaceae bacterium]MBT5525861.1 acyl-CoA dehydrogenase [Rhodospirillaceae bacterium]MBT6912509.1 acyl-CoA dehydrogenase [Rhodospirillaceae bacterium]MBT7976936.1 acyl-CoA dehydrogenase [Rhodospirillaceae bacterium]